MIRLDPVQLAGALLGAGWLGWLIGLVWAKAYAESKLQAPKCSNCGGALDGRLHSVETLGRCWINGDRPLVTLHRPVFDFEDGPA